LSKPEQTLALSGCSTKYFRLYLTQKEKGNLTWDESATS